MSINVIKPELFTNMDNVRAFFTTKNEGITQDGAMIPGLNLGFNTGEYPHVVKKNRQLMLQEFSIDPEWVAFANQVHSNRVQVVTEGGTFAHTDALITQIPGLALGIQVADCAAVLIADEAARTVAAVHAGWRGAVGDIVPITVGKMKKLGVQPINCKAFISPCISLPNFEVGSGVAEQFPDRFVDYEKYIKPHIDLKNFLAWQLRESGVQNSNIEVHPGCTLAKSGQFYSYRLENDQSGRMMALIQVEGQ